jgi:hypothetical protein
MIILIEVMKFFMILPLTFAAWRSGGLVFRPPNQLLIIDSNAHCNYVLLQVNVQLGLMFKSVLSAHLH